MCDRLGVDWGQFGIDLGAMWGRSGADLRSVSGRSGVNSGPIWSRFGVDLGSISGQSRANLGSIWGRFGVDVWGPLGGSIWGRCWVDLGTSASPGLPASRGPSARPAPDQHTRPHVPRQRHEERPRRGARVVRRGGRRPPQQTHDGHWQRVGRPQPEGPRAEAGPWPPRPRARAPSAMPLWRGRLGWGRSGGPSGGRSGRRQGGCADGAQACSRAAAWRTAHGEEGKDAMHMIPAEAGVHRRSHPREADDEGTTQRDARHDDEEKSFCWLRLAGPSPHRPHMRLVGALPPGEICVDPWRSGPSEP